MKTLDSVFAALQKLRGDVAELNAALLNHERTLAAGRRDTLTLLNFTDSSAG